MSGRANNFFDAELRIRSVTCASDNLTAMSISKVIVIAKVASNKVYYQRNNFAEALIDECIRKRNLLRRSDKKLEESARKLISKSRIDIDIEKELNERECFEFLEQVTAAYPAYQIVLMKRDNEDKYYTVDRVFNEAGYKKMTILSYEGRYDATSLSRRILGNSNEDLLPIRRKAKHAPLVEENVESSVNQGNFEKDGRVLGDITNRGKTNQSRKRKLADMEELSIDSVTVKMANMHLM